MKSIDKINLIYLYGIILCFSLKITFSFSKYYDFVPVYIWLAEEMAIMLHLNIQRRTKGIKLHK